MNFSVHVERWSTIRPFRISSGIWQANDLIVVELSRNGAFGRGEAAGVYYIGETIDSMLAQLEAVASNVRAGIDREALQHLLPAGGARNALDCALWDLEAKETGRSVWHLSGLGPRPVETAMTIGIEDTPEQAAASARAASVYGRLKIKLDADRPLERIRAIREARPDAHLVVDANQGWNFALLREVVPAMLDLDVKMIEQPLPRGGDAELADYRSQIPLCADESCLDERELAQAANRYQSINIKLDKCGGLTAALALAASARALGLGLLTGCMGGTSLSMAPAFVVASVSDLADLDGGLWQKHDRLPGLQFDGGVAAVFPPALWG